MSVLEDYTKLKKSVDEAQQQADRASGALDGVKGRLKKEFGCNSLKSAKTKLAALEKEEETKREELGVAIEEFEEAWEGGDEE